MTIVARFEIPFIQILDEQGNLTAELPEFAQSEATLLHLYKQMVLTRTFDKKAIALQRTGKMGTYASINGQEAISCAIGNALATDDVFVPYYRDYAAQLQRGVTMSDILSYWGGDERGSNFSVNKEDLPISVPIASQCQHAAGVAFAIKYRNQKRVALTTCGDGGTSEGDFYEAMNVAGVWNLPLVFVVNNNHWAISVPLNHQTAAKTLAQKAIAAGFDGIQVDGNDILAMREVVGNAIEKARNGGGPTLIEALSYRLCDHTTADDATRYQPAMEVKCKESFEPIKRFKQYLINQNMWNDEKEMQLLDECSEKVQKAVDAYLNRPKQTIESAFDYHYAQLPEYLIEQRAQAIEEASYA